MRNTLYIPVTYLSSGFMGDYVHTVRSLAEDGAQSASPVMLYDISLWIRSYSGICFSKCSRSSLSSFSFSGSLMLR